MIKSIGERYKSARKFLGVTLKEIYQQTGVSSSIISRIESISSKTGRKTGIEK